jgi:DNA-binding NtrC family response regulator
LENVIGHACMMVMGDTIDVQDLPPYLQKGNAETSESAVAASASPDDQAGLGTLEDQERMLIVRALEACQGNQSQAARMLRIGRDALRYKLKKHNLG